MERVFPLLAATSGPYEQLLAAEQTAQSVQEWIKQKKDVIRTIKQQAVDQCLPYDVTYGHLKLLEDDVHAFKQLLESNEVSRAHWRGLHMAAWRATVRPLKVVDLPKEILEMIFSNFEDVPVPQIQVNTRSLYDYDYIPFQFDGDLPSPDLPSIKNVRLTCRVFCDAGSKFLLPLLDIFITRSSLQRLDEVSNHPTMSKGVQVIRIHTDEYKASLANDRIQFCDKIDNDLREIRWRFNFKESSAPKQVARDCRLVGLLPKPEFLKNQGLDMVMTEIDDVLVAVNKYRKKYMKRKSKAVPQFDRFEAKIARAIVQAHKEYERRYLEQKSLAKHSDLHKKISTALRHMPCLQKLCITKICRNPRGDTWYSGWGHKLDGRRWQSILKGSNPFKEMMMAQTGSNSYSSLNETGASTISLELELSLLLRAGNGNLRHLDITFPPAEDCPMGIAAEHLQQLRHLRHACQHLKFVRVRIDRPRDIWSAPASLGTTYTQLEAILASPELEVVKLDLMAEYRLGLLDRVASVGPLLETLSWKRLQTVCLAHFTIKVEELRQLLSQVIGKLHLDLTHILLLQGTWAEALDVLRGKADPSSRVVSPRGVEMTAMLRDEWEYLQDQFDSEHCGTWYSAQRCPGRASFYIRGGNIPNPLIWGSEIWDSD